jgi:hypothetical protein
MRNRRRPDPRSLGQELFAPRQVYVRSGAASQFVTLSRGLQILVTAGFAVVALWLGLASWTAVAKHLETVQQGRELARLEGLAQTLRSAVEGAQDDQRVEGGAAASAELVSELAAVKAERARALVLAKVTADEAAELRREVALANQRVEELKRALVQGEVVGRPLAELLEGAGKAASVAGGALTEVAAEPR